MEIKKIWLISFSPTGTSKKAIEAIGSGITDSASLPVEVVNLTYPDAISELQIGADELAVFGVPVYAGRVAPLAVNRLAAVKGAMGPAVIAVTYGNREYEDALVELSDLAEKAGFCLIAGCTFIGEHSFSAAATPIAVGRPDAGDQTIARGFGKKIFKKIKGIETSQEAKSSLPEIPGNRPYKDGMASLPITPQVDVSSCTHCGECVSTCPGGAITLSSNLEIDSELCIFCCACIKTCPEEAVSIAAPPMQEKRQWLFENCVEPKKPEIFI